MKGSAHWDPHRQRGTYGKNIHHGELRTDAMPIREGGTAGLQDLTNKKGIEAAKKSLRERSKK